MIWQVCYGEDVSELRLSELPECDWITHNGDQVFAVYEVTFSHVTVWEDEEDG